MVGRAARQVADNKLLVERLLAERIPGVRYSGNRHVPGMARLQNSDCPMLHFLDRGWVAFNPGQAGVLMGEDERRPSPELVAEGISRMVSAMVTRDALMPLAVR